MSSENKVALITGANRGIGYAIALELAKQGLIIAGTATSPEGAEKITAVLKKQGYKGQGFVVNIAKFETIDPLLKAIQDTFAPPDILVNNAAITRDNLVLRMKSDEWHDVINTNLNAVYYLSKSCVKNMIKKRWGRIINISSVVGLTGNPGQANYATAKAGLIAFSKSLAMEIASRHITVNCVAPGFIETDMTNALTEQQRAQILDRVPAKRLGSPEDVAAIVGFLASDAASYIVGATIHVNGGMYMV